MSNTLAHGRRVLDLLRSGGGRHARWGVLDQGLSSATNFGVTAVAARYADPERFGAFSFAFAVYILALWVARSLVAEPFVVRLTHADPPTRAEDGARALGAAAALGAAGAAAMVALALAADPTARPVLLAMACSLPVLLVQDTYRYLLIVGGRTPAAAAADGVWLAFQAVAVAVLVATHRPGAAWLTATFGAGAALAALAAGAGTGVRPALAGGLAWLRRHADLGVPFLYELVVINGVAQVTLLAIGLADHVVTVGELRTGMLLYGPLTVVFGGVFLVGLPEAVKVSASPERVTRLVVAIGVATTVSTAAWAAALALVPDRTGTALLGANWAAGHRLVVPVALLTIASAWMLAITVGLRALDAARRTLARRTLGAPLILVLGLAGALADGSVAAATGMAAGSWVSAALAWTAFRGVA